MSIENNLKKSADALERIATALEALVAQGPVPVEPVAAPAPVAEAPAAPVSPAPPTPPAAAIPTPPPAPAAPVSPNEPGVQVPFTDINGLVQYVMGKYQSLGAEKGAGIQGILVGLGYGNINDVQPAHFAEFYTQVEAIK